MCIIGFTIRVKNDLSFINWISSSGMSIGFAYLAILLQYRNISDVEIGLLAIPYSISMILSNTLFGRLSDEYGRRKFLIIGLFTSALTMFLYIFPRTFWGFAFIRLLHGITLGIYPSSITGLASDRKDKLGSLSSFGSLGWATGALAGGIVAQITGIDSIFIMSSLLFLISFLFVYFNGTGIGYTPQIRNITTSRYKYFLAIKHNWKEYIVIILRHGFANSIWVFWPLFLKDTLGLSLSQIGMVQVGNTLTQFIVMKSLGDKFNCKKMFIVGGYISALAFILFPLTHNFIQIFLTQIVLGISWAFFYVGAVRSVEADNRDDDIVATGTGLLNASLSISQIIGPMLGLWFITISHTYTLSMNIAGIVTMLTITIYFIFYLSTFFREKQSQNQLEVSFL